MVKLVQEKIGKTLDHIGIANNFMNKTPIIQHLRERIDIWAGMKLKSFCTATEIVTRLKRKPTEWGKILASYTFDKRLIMRIYIGRSETNPAKNQQPTE
jgi:hypothetical protein